MLGKALDYPTSGEKSAAAVVIGGVFVLFRAVFGIGAFTLAAAAANGPTELPTVAGAIALGSGALILEVPLRGYRVRVLRSAAVGADAPGFDDARRLVRDGVGGLAVYLVYLLPAIAAFLLAAGGNASVAGDPQAVGQSVLRNLAGFALLAGLLYFVAMSYVLPAAMTNFAHEGDWRAAFHLGTVVDGAFSEDYAVAWVLATVLQLLAFPFLSLLWVLVVGALIQFYLAVAVRYLWGTGYGRATGSAPSGEPTDDDEDAEPEGLLDGRTVDDATSRYPERVDETTTEAGEPPTDAVPGPATGGTGIRGSAPETAQSTGDSDESVSKATDEADDDRLGPIETGDSAGDDADESDAIPTTDPTNDDSATDTPFDFESGPAPADSPDEVGDESDVGDDSDGNAGSDTDTDDDVSVENKTFESTDTDDGPKSDEVK